MADLNIIKRNDFKRNTAYRIFIGMLALGEPEFNSANNKNLRNLKIFDKEVTRINIIGNVIEKFASDNKNYATLTIDDGTGSVRVKGFSDSYDMINSFNQGDTINVIGNLRFYNDEIYVMPEIIKIVSVNWLIARKLELEKEYGKDILKKIEEAQAQAEQFENTEENKEYNEKVRENDIKNIEDNKEKIIEEKIEINSLHDEILEKIRAAEPEGLDIDKIIMDSKIPVEEINNIVIELLESGEVYEPKPGRLRLL